MISILRVMRHKLARKVGVFFIGLGACTVVSAPANGAEFIPTYRITSPYNIAPILLFDRGVYPDSGQASGAFTTRGNQNGGLSTRPGTTVLTGNSTNLLQFRSFILGVTDLVPGSLAQDQDTQAHLILGVGNFYGASLIGQEFATIFPGYDEAGLISAVRTVADFNLGNDPEFEPEFAAAFSTVASFEDMIFTNSPNSHFKLNEGFSMIAFSRGQLAGTGFLSAGSVAAVPEPATWAMMLLGFGGLGYSMRRRRVLARTPALA